MAPDFPERLEMETLEVDPETGDPDVGATADAGFDEDPLMMD